MGTRHARWRGPDVFPTTRVGWTAVTLLGLGVVAFVIQALLVRMGSDGDAAMLCTGVTGSVAVAGAGLISTVAFVRGTERAVVSAIIGAAGVVFLAALVAMLAGSR